MYTKNNKVVAEFMGLIVITKEQYLMHPNHETISIKEYSIVEYQRYHSDYNWLIPAIGKLNEEMESSLFKTDVFSKISSMILVNDINGAYQYFVEALRQHNQQKLNQQ